MYAIELESEELEVLEQLLQTAAASLEVEIRHTDHGDFKDHLKNRRQVLQRVIAKAIRREPLAA